MKDFSLDPEVDENPSPEEEFYQLSRLALSGADQSLRLFIKKTAHRYRSSNPAFGRRLMHLVRSSLVRKSSPVKSPLQDPPLKNAAKDALKDVATSPAPVDCDSRWFLIRTERPRLSVAPVWPQVVKSCLDQLLAERRMQSELLQYGVNPTRTVLFTGLPGVGKTLAANWLAEKSDLPLLTLDLSSVISSYLGKTGANVRNVLDYAKAHKCILFLDEIDAVAKKRDDPGEIGELKRLVTVLLQEIDCWPSHNLLVAATNHSSLLDPAIWRRFDMIVEFPLPELSEVRTLVSQRIPSFLSKAEASRWSPCLEQLLIGQSFSDVSRELNNIVRRAITTESSDFVATLEAFVSQRVEQQSPAARSAMACSLVAAGFSQRKIQILTGLSRDTIRKRCKGASNDDTED